MHAILLFDNPQTNKLQFVLSGSADLSGLTQYPFSLLCFEGLTPLMLWLAHPTHLRDHNPGNRTPDLHTQGENADHYTNGVKVSSNISP